MTILPICINAGLLAAAALFSCVKISILDRLRAGRNTHAQPQSFHSTSMVSMDGFRHMLNWRLEEGSHRLPGRHGGTCINEAAVVAAGYAYRPIPTAAHMPLCFSQPICRFALRLNDDASDRERQQLLAFVTRLACADTPEVERKRRDFIASHDKWGLAFQQRLQVLEGALAIGRQAEPLMYDEWRARVETIKAQAPRSRLSSAAS